MQACAIRKLLNALLTQQDVDGVSDEVAPIRLGRREPRNTQAMKGVRQICVSRTSFVVMNTLGLLFDI